MELSTVNGDFDFCLKGRCPHCGHYASFATVTRPFIEDPNGKPDRVVGAARCAACSEYILGILGFVPNPSGPGFIPAYEAHYPAGKPDESVPDGVPEDVARDFREAMRCRWIDAYNATAEMCRRALQASCIQLGAGVNDRLIEQIDWVASQGKITKPLQEMAHNVRFGGNRGAHPPDDPTDILGAEDADAVIEFTREYFRHVYEMPEKMARFDFSKRAASKKP